MGRLSAAIRAAAVVPPAATAPATRASTRRPSSGRAPERWRARPLPRALEAAIVAVLALGCAAWALQLWRADLTVPLRYAPVDDTKFYLMLVKGIVEHGWYLANPHLGAPFGQQLSDYPQGADNLNLAIVRALALFTSDAALIVNLFFLLTFALVAFVAHLVLRSLGLGRTAAGVVAVLYSLLAYHFFRGESHLLLSAYYAVPLAAYLFLALLDGRPLFTARPAGAPRPLAWASGRSLATIAICVVIGSENLYYATFAAVMLAAATSIALAQRRARTAITGLAIVALIAASVGANLAPSLLYRAEHGTNVALERSAAFTEQSDEAFSLRLSNLVLPAPGSRIAPLREVAATYDHAIAPGYCEACYASLGTVGTIGFLWLLACVVAALLAGVGVRLTRNPLVRHASVGVIVALVVASVGGIASLIEVFVTADIRAWNRISVFIAFLSLLAAGLLLEVMLARLRRLPSGGALAAGAAVGVLLFGVYDQTSASFVPAYAGEAHTWSSDARFVREIETRLPPGAGVFQLPYVPFPEGYPETPVGDQVATYSTKYEPLRGYLHSVTLRWSYGAMKGRPSDWSAQLAGQPLSYVLAAATAAGFDGLWVDPAGFEPAKAAAMRTTLEALLSQAPLVSPLGDLWFFDLRPYRALLRRTEPPALVELLRERTLRPLRTTCSAAGIALENPTGGMRAATLTLHVARAGHTYDATHSGAPDGQAEDYPGSAAITLSRRLQLAPGTIRIARIGYVSGAGSAPQVLYATLTEDSLLRFARLGGARAQTLVPGLSGPPCPGS